MDAAPDMVKWLIQIGATGVLCWVLYYLLTKIIPDLQKGYSDALDKHASEAAEQRKMFSDELSKQRDENAAILNSLHQQMHERDEKIIQALSELQEGRKQTN